MSEKREKPVRLIPPPKLDERKSATLDSRGWGVAHWATAAGLFLLLGIMVTVFVVLPNWIEESKSGAELQIEQEVNSSQPASTIEGSPAAVTGKRSEVVDSEPQNTAIRDREPVRPRPPVAVLPEKSRPGEILEETHHVDLGREAFVDAMTAGLQALENDQPQAAWDAFGRAVELDPGSTAAAEGLARAETALQRFEIERYRRRAEIEETAEDWRAALASWESVLAIDRAIESALEGAARSRKRAELAEQLDFHIANPERLSADEVMLEASELLARAREIVDRGPSLELQIADLDRVIEAAATPVRVTLESDDLTEVEIYRVGRMGKFRRRTLELRPGIYTVVGRRRGYRDVRRVLEVSAGKETSPTLRILCEEAV